MFETLNFVFPTATALQEVQRVLIPQMQLEDPIFEFFPVVTRDEWRLKWRQRDNFLGMQQVRGLEGSFRTVDATGAKEYDFEPGVYGESSFIGEKELTERAQMASLQGFAPINDIVADRNLQLMTREFTRIKSILWTLMSTGAFSVSDGTGAVKHVGRYPFTTVNAAVAWGTRATATPFADIIGLRRRAAGQSATFGAGAKVFINAIDAEHLMLNANPADVFGRRTAYGSTVNSVGELNRLFKQAYDTEELPEIVVYDGGYFSDGRDGNAAGTFVRYIPTGRAVVIGRRLDGSPLGEYRVCRNALNDNMAAGFYQRLRDLRQIQSPGGFMLERGHNGGPVVWFTGPVIILNLAP